MGPLNELVHKTPAKTKTKNPAKSPKTEASELSKRENVSEMGPLNKPVLYTYGTHLGNRFAAEHNGPGFVVWIGLDHDLFDGDLGIAPHLCPKFEVVCRI